MRSLSAAVLLLLPLVSPAANDVPAGRDLFPDGNWAGWEFVATPATELAAVCAVKPDGVLAFAGKPIGFVATRDSFHDYRLHVEWRWTEKPGNGGILVHIASGPKDRAWPLCFQIQTKHKSVGDLLPMAGATFAEPLTSAPGTTALRARSGADGENPAGEWNECDLVCSRDTIVVLVNGAPQNRVTGCSLTAGRIGLQFEGAPFEVRHVRLIPLE